jgi:hypothetical protein
MKTMIIIFLGMFVWTMTPIEAMADKGNKHQRNSSDYRYRGDHARHDDRRTVRREHRDHRHNYRDQRQHQRQQYQNEVRWQRERERYVRFQPRLPRIAGYNIYTVPTGHIYTSVPGVSFYLGW